MKYVLRLLLKALLGLTIRVEAKGHEFLPKKGGFVVAVNHLGIIDAALAFYMLPQWDLFLIVGKKWNEIAVIRWLGKTFNLIFVDPVNADIKTLRKVMDLIKHDEVLAITPEGTRSSTGALIEAKPGVGYLAAKLNCPILPIAITGTEDQLLFRNLRRLRRTPVTATAGPTFTLPPLPKEGRDAALKKYTDEIMCRIGVLLPEQYRGVYAEHPRLKELLSQP
jgi:1-acyl-sn-glycerol-3-phosphate acyltransferase